jgi:hypothetical protein
VVHNRHWCLETGAAAAIEERARLQAKHRNRNMKPTVPKEMHTNMLSHPEGTFKALERLLSTSPGKDDSIWAQTILDVVKDS